MPSKRRYYSAGVKEALFLLSRGRCYRPTCYERVLRTVDGDPSLNVQIAHIRARELSGARFDPALQEEERDRFPNLILLCQACHSSVDKKANEARYPVELLEEWKTERETEFSGKLDGLDVLSKDDLEEMMVRTVTEAKDEILDAIGTLDTVSRESANMLRTLVTESFDRPYLDLDAVASLANSARSLQHLPDSTSALNRATRKLGDLSDNATSLNNAAGRLAHLPDTIAALDRATKALMRCQ